MKTKLLLLVIVCIAVTSFLYGCNNISQQKAEPYRKQIFALDTIIDLTIYDSRGEELSVLSENRINELDEDGCIITYAYIVNPNKKDNNL